MRIVGSIQEHAPWWLSRCQMFNSCHALSYWLLMKLWLETCGCFLGKSVLLLATTFPVGGVAHTFRWKCYWVQTCLVHSFWLRIVNRLVCDPRTWTRPFHTTSASVLLLSKVFCHTCLYFQNSLIIHQSLSSDQSQIFTI